MKVDICTNPQNRILKRDKL